MENRIITIGRQYGSGGRLIGEEIARSMNIKCYDKELLTKTANKLGYCQEVVERIDEQPTNSVLYAIVMGINQMGKYSDTTMNSLQEQIALSQFDVIKNIAEKESCVIVGRCAEYILKDKPGVVRIFIEANEEERIKRIAKINRLSEMDAVILLRKTDKKRAAYYKHFTSLKWGDSKNYDLVINTSKVGYDGAVKVIQTFIANSK